MTDMTVRECQLRSKIHVQYTAFSDPLLDEVAGDLDPEARPARRVVAPGESLHPALVHAHSRALHYTRLD